MKKFGKIVLGGALATATVLVVKSLFDKKTNNDEGACDDEAYEEVDTADSDANTDE